MVAGYEKHADRLEFADEYVASLKNLVAKAEADNIKQEQLKADLLKTTEVLNSDVQEGSRTYASLMRFAKGSFGPGSNEIKDFKSTGE